MTTSDDWDLVIVGAGPAGSAAALGALARHPDARVLLLDRAGFPRDKSCGDGIAPHALDVLADVGAGGLYDDWAPVTRLRLQLGERSVARSMARPALVIPRRVFDSRLVARAVEAGAVLRCHRVRSVRIDADSITVDDTIRARVLVGADGAHSGMRRYAGLSPVGRRALALRGYVPTPDTRRGEQLIVFGQARQPSYAWSFDRGDGLSNVGYGEVLNSTHSPPSRRLLLSELDRLLPGSVDAGHSWLGHHLPLSTWRWRQPDGRILLAGDAAGLVNPMTGEGIFYAVLTGALAGKVAAEVALGQATAADSGRLYRREVQVRLARHLRHTAVLSRLVAAPEIVVSGIVAASAQQGVFDDLVEIGLGNGRITSRTAGQVLRHAPVAIARLGRERRETS
ncbi:MAG: NAD(P)/FAD-dependent oxidoreductase [Nocardioidaceae bacterium]